MEDELGGKGKLYFKDIYHYYISDFKNGIFHWKRGIYKENNIFLNLGNFENDMSNRKDKLFL